MACKFILLEGTDSNRRTRKGAELQSAGFNHSPTFQFDFAVYPGFEPRSPHRQ